MANDGGAAGETILVTRDGAVATLTLNRPEALNVLDLAMMDALVARTAALAADSTLRVVSRLSACGLLPATVC